MLIMERKWRIFSLIYLLLYHLPAAIPFPISSILGSGLSCPSGRSVGPVFLTAEPFLSCTAAPTPIPIPTPISTSKIRRSRN